MRERVTPPGADQSPLFTSLPDGGKKASPRKVKGPTHDAPSRVLITGIELVDLEYYTERKKFHLTKFNDLTPDEDPSKVNAEHLAAYLRDRQFTQENDPHNLELALSLGQRLYLSGLRALGKARKEEEHVNKLRNALQKVSALDVKRKERIERGIVRRLKTMTNHRKRGLTRLERAGESDPSNLDFQFALVQEYSDLEIRAGRSTSATGKRIHDRITESHQTASDVPFDKPRRTRQIAYPTSPQ